MTDLRQIVDRIAPRERGGAAPPHASLYPSFARMSLTAARYVVLATLLPNLDPHLAKKVLGLEGGGLPFCAVLLN
jgi:adenine-specific DNA methylase